MEKDTNKKMYNLLCNNKDSLKEFLIDNGKRKVICPISFAKMESSNDSEVIVNE